MTQMDGVSNLVYSSVLPDQSFLTGVNSAYNFIDLDGSDEYINVADNDTLDLTNNYTISIWFNADSLDAEVGILGKRTPTEVNGNWILWYGDDGGGSNYLRFWKHTGSGWQKLDTTLTISTGSWYNIIITHDGTNTTLFSNSSQIATTTSITAIVNTSEDLVIGQHGQSQFFDGKIGQTAIWSKDLTNDVGSIYNAGRHTNLLDSYSDNCVGLWAMSALDALTGLSDIGNGTIYDRSGNSNHGTATATEASDLASSPNAEPNGYAKGDTNRSTTIP